MRSDLAGVHVVSAEGEFFTELTLKVLEERAALVRCHKQYLLNLDRLDEITLLESGLAEVRTRSRPHRPRQPPLPQDSPRTTLTSEPDHRAFFRPPIPF